MDERARKELGAKGQRGGNEEAGATAGKTHDEVLDETLEGDVARQAKAKGGRDHR